jgi:hypothetical protein
MKDFKRVMMELADDMHFERSTEDKEKNRSASRIINVYRKSKSRILTCSRLFLMKVLLMFLQISHGSTLFDSQIPWKSRSWKKTL